MLTKVLFGLFLAAIIPEIALGKPFPRRMQGTDSGSSGFLNRFSPRQAGSVGMPAKHASRGMAEVMPPQRNPYDLIKEAQRGYSGSSFQSQPESQSYSDFMTSASSPSESNDNFDMMSFPRPSIVNSNPYSSPPSMRRFGSSHSGAVGKESSLPFRTMSSSPGMKRRTFSSMSGDPEDY